jgi:hypothetical protein
MTTIEIVKATAVFQALNNQMVLSASLIDVFANAIEMKKAGFTYAAWEAQTGAGKLAKQIVKEIFA